MLRRIMNQLPEVIVLTGFRATGKTSVGRLLAARLGYTFVDADAVLCERLGGTVAQIVARSGWDSFRQAERALLLETRTMTRTVLATGGGAIEHTAEWRRLREQCLIVWLEADEATIRRRMAGDAQTAAQRPSLTGEAPVDEIATLLARRTPLYAAGSDVRLDTVGRTPDELVGKLAEMFAAKQAARRRGGPVTQGGPPETAAPQGGRAMSEDSSNAIRSVWLVTREYEGLAGAGGVKDVCRQLAESLVAHGGCSVRVVLPRYGFVDAAHLGFTPAALGDAEGRIGGRRFGHVFEVDMHYADEERRERVAVWQGTINGVRIFLVEADRFATKRGVYTYTEEDELEVAWQRAGGGHFDYFAMNVLLQKAALDLMILLEERPNVIHCHDGHAAILPAMMRENAGWRAYFRRTGAVVTVHNAGLGYHQEVDDLDFARAVTALPERVILSSRLGGSFDPFLAAAPYAVLNTVSENYGRELQETPDDARTGWLGHALLDRGMHLAGITNGIDPASFDPARPEQLGLAAAFDVSRGELAGKKICKETLLQRIAATGPWERVKQFGSLRPEVDPPLFTFIGRLTAQKGVDILIRAIGDLLPLEPLARFLVFGSGSPELEQQLESLTASASGLNRVCFLRGFDPLLANSIYAAGDFFLIPSRYEPCGLTDYMAQLLGNLPIVHRVGGLVKVIDGETGFAYDENTPEALALVMGRALTTYADDPGAIRTMQMAAVERIARLHTWEKVMDDYLLLYRQARNLYPAGR